MSTFWTDNVKASLEVALGNVKRLPAGETLTPKALNEILDLMNQVKHTFLVQAQIQGFIRLGDGGPKP
jgi:hypothetical protein